MLAPFVLFRLFVIPGRSGTRTRATAAARAGSAPETEVVPVRHPQSLLLWGGGAGRRGQVGPRRVSRTREDIQLLAEAAVGADLRALPSSQKGLRADSSNGAGEEVRAAVPERDVLRKAPTQASRAHRGSLAGHKVHWGGVRSLVGHPRARGEGRLRQLSTTADRSATRGANPTTALLVAGVLALAGGGGTAGGRRLGALVAVFPAAVAVAGVVPLFVG